MTDNASEANDQPGKQDVHPETSSGATWSLMDSTTLEGKLGIIIAWYYDGNFEDVPTDRAMVSRLLRCARSYLDGHIERLTTEELLRLHDALASYPGPDADLDQVGGDLFRRWHKQLIAHHATEARPALAGALTEVPTATLQKLIEILQGELSRRKASAS